MVSSAVPAKEANLVFYLQMLIALFAMIDYPLDTRRLCYLMQKAFNCEEDLADIDATITMVGEQAQQVIDHLRSINVPHLRVKLVPESLTQPPLSSSPATSMGNGDGLSSWKKRTAYTREKTADSSPPPKRQRKSHRSDVRTPTESECETDNLARSGGYERLRGSTAAPQKFILEVPKRKSSSLNVHEAPSGRSQLASRGPMVRSDRSGNKGRDLPSAGDSMEDSQQSSGDDEDTDDNGDGDEDDDGKQPDPEVIDIDDIDSLADGPSQGPMPFSQPHLSQKSQSLPFTPSDASQGRTASMISGISMRHYPEDQYPFIEHPSGEYNTGTAPMCASFGTNNSAKFEVPQGSSFKLLADTWDEEAKAIVRQARERASAQEAGSSQLRPVLVDDNEEEKLTQAPKSSLPAAAFGGNVTDAVTDHTLTDAAIAEEAHRQACVELKHKRSQLKRARKKARKAAERARALGSGIPDSSSQTVLPSSQLSQQSQSGDR